MIIEGKKKTAFDLLGAAMKLSDAYHANGIKRSVTVGFYGNAEAIDLTFFDWSKCGRKKQLELVCSFTVYINDADYGDTFEKAFEAIRKEMEEIENGRTNG